MSLSRYMHIYVNYIELKKLYAKFMSLFRYIHKTIKTVYKSHVFILLHRYEIILNYQPMYKMYVFIPLYVQVST